MKAAHVFEHLPFATRAEEEGMGSFLVTEASLSTLQINITKRCNLACKHCHVSSHPMRAEEMSGEALEACLDVYAAGSFAVLDITGGAPELHPQYCWLIEQASDIAMRKQAEGLSARIITRTNAAILTQPGYEDLPAFWATLGIEVVASLPHYEERKTNRMRGSGVFEQVVAGLRMLNAAGYSTGSEMLTLNIAVNPGGAILPPPQASAEREYKSELAKRYGITFDNLLVITNNPVGRFKEFLEDREMLDEYMGKLYNAFNPATVASAMCRSQISADTDGRLYDCDFNQIVELPLLASCKTDNYPFVDADGKPLAALTIFDVQREGLDAVTSRKMRISGHCYACTAGAGSSCGGSTT